eukprot:NODE_388_length_9508_cov_0.225954.p1 type:complete len:659 gc:universal NODE_388_length_9508_cov_0.225954:4627-6603(+)
MKFHSTAVDQQLLNNVEKIYTTSNVLIIYTGGTIGMQQTTNHGYIPVPKHLQHLLSSMIQFHDPLHTYKPVDSPVIDKFPNYELQLLCRVKDKDIYLPALKTPPSLFNKSIVYSILEYDPLLDSSNLSMQNWIEIATDIKNNYDNFDAFLILHGTDTMAYTASALSFMLENLGKTVILTGSQIPLSEVRNDAVYNLLGALTICGHYLIPEVSLYFDNKLFRGNRSTKIDTTQFDAFDSPNCAPLVVMGIKINVNWSIVWKPLDLSPFKVHTAMSSEVACLRIFPGLQGKTIEAFISSGIKGIVLESFGCGNIPSNRPDILEALQDAFKNGVIIINCTQCGKGSVIDSYETGAVLNKVGVIPGNDMTVECALTKLSYLLGKQLPLQSIRELLKSSLRGELSIPEIDQFSIKSNAITNVLDKVLGNSTASTLEATSAGAESLKRALYPGLFITACSTNNIKAINDMLDDYKPDTNWLINSSDYDSRTPLHIACTKGHLETVKILLIHGAYVHSKDVFGHTSIFYALKFKLYSIVDLLLESGAKLAIPAVTTRRINNKILHVDGLEVTDMMMQFVIDDDIDMLQLFIRCGADINVGNVQGQTLLHISSGLARLEIVELLIKKKIDVNLTDAYGEKARDVAARCGQARVLNILDAGNEFANK